MQETKRLIPVIHVRDEWQTILQAELCEDLGLGCFLIAHSNSYKVLFEIAESVHNNSPGLWIGLNALDLPPAQVFFKCPRYISAIWNDDGGIDEIDGKIFTIEAEQTLDALNESSFGGQYFGSFAFKYQAKITNLEAGAQKATSFMDIVTTSGEGTGIAADLDKIKRIHKGINGICPLALASGVTLENVEHYLPYVDYFLVATGISKNPHELDKDKVEALRDKIQNYENTR